MFVVVVVEVVDVKLVGVALVIDVELVSELVALAGADAVGDVVVGSADWPDVESPSPEQAAITATASKQARRTTSGPYRPRRWRVA